MNCKKCKREIYYVMDSSGTVGRWWTAAERDRDAKAMQKEWSNGKCSHEPSEPEHNTPPETAPKVDSSTTSKPSTPFKPLQYPQIPPASQPTAFNDPEFLKLAFDKHTKLMVQGMIEKGIATTWIEAIDIMAWFCHCATTHIMKIEEEKKDEPINKANHK